MSTASLGADDDGSGGPATPGGLPAVATAPAGAPPPAAITNAPASFGRLEPVPLGKYFKDEARDFTPWLAKEENLTLLGEAIEMSLELVATEQYIGPFRADIIARQEDLEVIIENQLHTTDHKHLGQLLVYAANRGSGVIVWVARAVTDEYRKVIDWLNLKTDVAFFALEVELWRIGESAVAPKFNVVCRPQSPVVVPTSGTVGATAQRQLEFWTGLTEYMSENATSFGKRKPGAQHWHNLRIGTGRAHVAMTALANGRMGCELYIGSSQSDDIFAALEQDKTAIETELDAVGQLEWMPLPEKKASRIAIYSQDVGSLSDEATWPTAYAWLVTWAEKFRSTFAERVKAVVLPEQPDTDGSIAVSAESALDGGAGEPT